MNLGKKQEAKDGASFMKYELVEKKGEKVLMPVRYSIRKGKQAANVSMD